MVTPQEVQQAIASQQQWYAQLFAGASSVANDVDVNLAAVNGKQVEVFEVPFSSFPVVNGHRADATCIQEAGRYVIFVSDQPAEPTDYPAIRGDWLQRKLVLHEYDHITNGETFEDNPQSAVDLTKRRALGDVSAISILEARERRAEIYATHRLIAEAHAVGNLNVTADAHKFAFMQLGAPKLT